MRMSLNRALMVILLAWSSAGRANSIGPIPDGNATLDTGPVAKWIQTTWKSGGYSGNDLVHIKKDGTVVVYVQVNLVVTLPPVSSTDDPILTTIYGKQAGSPTVTGFDPSDLMSFDSQEEHIGTSGASYYSYFQTSVTALNLQSYLPGIDLSGFDTTSPTQSYELFKTAVPLAEITRTIPEPDILTLFLAAVAGLGLRAKRRCGRD